MDLFVLLERMGEIAPVYDWCNHLDGYAQLKQAQVLEYADTGGSGMKFLRGIPLNLFQSLLTGTICELCGLTVKSLEYY